MGSKFRFVDLFAGVGGFHQALADPEFGGECVLAVEWDEACRQVYKAAFPEMADDEKFIKDVRDITLADKKTGAKRSLGEIRKRVPPHEVLCAGFPCQPFSKSGPQLGIEDQARGTLFFDILRIVKARHPHFLILENVPNLISWRHEATWLRIVESLRNEGYRVSERPVVLSPHDLPEDRGGTPQVRKRVYILATRDEARRAEVIDEPLIPSRPFPDFDPADEWRIDHGYIQHGGDLRPYAISTQEHAWLTAWNEFVRTIKEPELPGHPIWVSEFRPESTVTADDPKWKRGFKDKNRDFYLRNRPDIDEWLAKTRKVNGESMTVRDFPPSRQKFEWQAPGWHKSRGKRKIWDLLIQLRPSGIRVKPPTYVPALVAITQTSIYAKDRRRLTPQEGARLQGLDWTPFAKARAAVGTKVNDKQIYKQLGNAVHVGAVRYVARQLFMEEGAPRKPADPEDEVV